MILAEFFVPAPTARKRNKRTKLMEDVPTFLNSNHRPHPHAKAKLTAAWRKAAHDAALAAGVDTLDQRVFIEAWVHLRANFQYDAQNFYHSAKAAVDGLIGDYKMLPGDDNAWVVGPLCLQGDKRPMSPGITLKVLSVAPGSMYPDSHGRRPHGEVE